MEIMFQAANNAQNVTPAFSSVSRVKPRADREGIVTEKAQAAFDTAKRNMAPGFQDAGGITKASQVRQPANHKKAALFIGQVDADEFVVATSSHQRGKKGHAANGIRGRFSNGTDFNMNEGFFKELANGNIGVFDVSKERGVPVRMDVFKRDGSFEFKANIPASTILNTDAHTMPTGEKPGIVHPHEVLGYVNQMRGNMTPWREEVLEFAEMDRGAHAWQQQHKPATAAAPGEEKKSG